MHLETTLIALQTSYITILDFALLPFIIVFVYAIARFNRNRRYRPGHPWRRYYLPALWVKIFGAVFIGIVYQYYYGNGDTFNYFYHAKIINSAMNESIGKWFSLMFHIPGKFDPAYYNNYTSQMFWYNDPSSYTVCSIAAFFSLFTYNTFLPTSVLFAYFSFTGIWALFRTFAAIYPKFTRPIAFAILFIPSTFVWGSGIFKDTLSLAGLGWLTYAVFRMLIQRDLSIKNWSLTIISFLLVFSTKLYILLAFLPALGIWILFWYTQRIYNKSARVLVKFIFFIIVATAAYFIMDAYSSSLGKYSIENIQQTAEATRGWISYASGDQGSAYSLGNYGSSVGSLIAQFPAAVVTTFFRPFPWEAGKIIVFLSALEALLFGWITLRLFFMVSIRKIWTTINSDPTIQFCFMFALIFGFAVGLTSANFGALSRYKIPCLPFFALGILLTWYKNQPRKKLLPFL